MGIIKVLLIILCVFIWRAQCGRGRIHCNVAFSECRRSPSHRRTIALQPDTETLCEFSPDKLNRTKNGMDAGAQRTRIGRISEWRANELVLYSLAAPSRILMRAYMECATTEHREYATSRSSIECKPMGFATYTNVCGSIPTRFEFNFICVDVIVQSSSQHVNVFVFGGALTPIITCWSSKCLHFPYRLRDFGSLFTYRLDWPENVGKNRRAIRFIGARVGNTCRRDRLTSTILVNIQRDIHRNRG